MIHRTGFIVQRILPDVTAPRFSSAELKRERPSVGDVRGLDLFWTRELVEDRVAREPFRRHTQKYTHTVISAIAHFRLSRESSYFPADKFGLWIVPPLIVTKDEIDFIVKAIDEALDLADAWVGKA